MIFIVFYVEIGTLSHAKILLELFLQNEKAQDYVIRQNQVSDSFKYGLYRKMFFHIFAISELK